MNRYIMHEQIKQLPHGMIFFQFTPVQNIIIKFIFKKIFIKSII